MIFTSKTFEALYTNFSVNLYLKQDASEPSSTNNTNEDLECLFCQQACLLFKVYPKEKLRAWRCCNHAHEVEYIATYDAIYYVFCYTTVCRDQRFVIAGYKLPGIEQYNLFGDEIHPKASILRLAFLPIHLSPDNIDQKIRTLLVWR